MAEVLHYQVLIIGGGVIGMSMMKALQALPISVALVERHAMPDDIPLSYDTRTIGLTYSSANFFKSLDIWPQLSPFAAAVRALEVSEQGTFAKLRMNAAEHGLDALGYVVEMPYILRALSASIKQANSNVIEHAELISCHATHSHMQCELQLPNQIKKVTADLVIAADGTGSQTRSLSKISITRHDYHQTAVVANASFSNGHAHRAYERFIQNEILAVLPLYTGHCGIVWTIPRNMREIVASYSDSAFIEKLQQLFGYRLGRVTRVGARAFYDLSQVLSNEIIGSRLALIGNAAQTIHPIGAQGLNLGLRDVATLQAVITNHLASIGDRKMLECYAKQRAADRTFLINMTDRSVRLFGASNFGLSSLRSAGLAIGSLSPTLQQSMLQNVLGWREGCARSLLVD